MDQRVSECVAENENCLMTKMTPLAQLAPSLVVLLALLVAPPSARGGSSGGGRTGGGGDTSVTLEGSPTSYAQFRQWSGGANATLELEFATSQTDALLLYADDARAAGEYIQLSLVGGAARLRFNWGGGRRGMLTAGANLNRAAGASSREGWHHVAVINGGGDTSLVVDGVYRASSASFTKSPSRGSFFSAARGNQSYVYVGGLPSWYADKTDMLSMPLVLLEPRLRGSVRRLRYRAASSLDFPAAGGRNQRPKGGVEAVQDMMAYKVSGLLQDHVRTYCTVYVHTSALLLCTKCTLE